MKRIVAILIAGILSLIPCMKVSARYYVDSPYVSHEDQNIIFEEWEKYSNDKDVPYLIVSLIEKESNGNEYAVGSTHDYGWCQIHTSVHQNRMRRLGIYNIYDKRQNVRVCCDILNDLFNEYSGWTNVLMHYNGTRNASALYHSGYYSDYAVDVMNRYYEFKEDVEAQKEAERIEKRKAAERQREKDRIEFIKRCKYEAKVPCAGAVREMSRVLYAIEEWEILK